jgi:hypothetical protein
MSIINNNINGLSLQSTPFPYGKMDNFLSSHFALELQNEILNIPSYEWDRYNNPFEQKYTLRDKYNFPPKCMELFDYLEL